MTPVKHLSLNLLHLYDMYYEKIKIENKLWITKSFVQTPT